MFTGIVEHLGKVASIDTTESGCAIVVDAGPLGEGLELGGSIAVNGVCLTAVDVEGGRVTFQAMAETLDRTSLGDLTAGEGVNLERPMRADGRFDGHIVQGHVDGVGAIRSVEPDGSSLRMWIDVPSDLLRHVVEKGSITVDGVSLTVAAVDGDGLEVALIPHTLEVTTLGVRHPGDRLNLEVDVIAKYVERMLGASL